MIAEKYSSKTQSVGTYDAFLRALCCSIADIKKLQGRGNLLLARNQCNYDMWRSSSEMARSHVKSIIVMSVWLP